jgi:hypothetical protein
MTIRTEPRARALFAIIKENTEVMKSFFMVSLVMILCGCGVYHIEEDDCVPQVPFVSTPKIRFNLVDVHDDSYSSVELEQSEQFLCVNVPSDGRSCKDFNLDYFPKAITTPLPEGSMLTLTGQMIRAVPWGLMTAFKGELVYLQGVVEGQVVWATETDLRVISMRPEVAESNLKSFRETKLPDGFGESRDWKCPNSKAD